ncbi:carbohydrate ABC transporter permease [Lederbergia lenta]|uniref:Sugar transporter permease n=1 Tax=Lederbergia lenta TaxID=1467 RepID=A0A2X4ZCE9_LEDLE|nr:sugar ABC transporter permease [Lederbergia lenta]MCM3111842.1 sugar ABC transporter permease [Lederbergia lenta]MEC2322996.1 sugar ABC transporter permease [Lederbergia lenta]SQI62175.1 sugar transporter permease [Lederbergia lenta]
MNLNTIFYKDGPWAFILLLPSLIGFLIFVLFPVVASFFLSFTSWDLLTPIQWIGFENYINLFNDETFKKVLWNTLYFTVVTVPVGIIISLFLAVALNQKIRFIKFYRAAYFLPVISSMVAVAVVWQWIYNPEYGLLNFILSLTGIQGPSWLSDTKWAMPAVMITSIWKGLGFNMLIFLAGIQGISESYYEAADIDGATWFKKFLYITVPLLRPTTFFVTVMAIIGSFQVFDAVFLMTGGGPARSTSVLVHYLYQNGFEYFRMGYASAMAYILFFLVLIFTFIQFTLQKKRGEV